MKQSAVGDIFEELGGESGTKVDVVGVVDHDAVRTVVTVVVLQTDGVEGQLDVVDVAVVDAHRDDPHRRDDSHVIASVDRVLQADIVGVDVDHRQSLLLEDVAEHPHSLGVDHETVQLLSGSLGQRVLE